MPDLPILPAKDYEIQNQNVFPVTKLKNSFFFSEPLLVYCQDPLHYKYIDKYSFKLWRKNKNSSNTFGEQLRTKKRVLNGKLNTLKGIVI